MDRLNDIKAAQVIIKELNKEELVFIWQGLFEDRAAFAYELSLISEFIQHCKQQGEEVDKSVFERQKEFWQKSIENANNIIAYLYPEECIDNYALLHKIEILVSETIV